MESTQEEIFIQDDSSVPGSSASMTALGGASSSGAAAEEMEEPSSSQPPIECHPDWVGLKNIWAFLWAPSTFIKEECSINDTARLKAVEKNWKKVLSLWSQLS
jgi:hypothetical protein